MHCPSRKTLNRIRLEIHDGDEIGTPGKDADCAVAEVGSTPFHMEAARACSAATLTEIHRVVGQVTYRVDSFRQNKLRLRSTWGSGQAVSGHGSKS